MSVTGYSSPSNQASGIVQINGTANQIEAVTANQVTTLNLDPALLSTLQALQAKLGMSLGIDDNLLYNGPLCVWQRGTNFSLTGPITAYTADRWQIKVAGSEPITASQVMNANGTYALKLIRTSGSANIGQVDICQSLPVSRSLSAQGQTLTLSFSAQMGSTFSAPNAQITASVIGGTGTSDGSYLSGNFVNPTVLATEAVTLLPTLSSYTLSVTVPSNITQLAVDISYAPEGQAGADDSLTVSHFYLGHNSNPVLNQDFAHHLKECLPFYQKSYSYSVAPGTLGQYAGMFFAPYSGTLGTNFALPGPLFGTPMRTIPTIQTFNFNTPNSNALSSGDNSVDYSSGSAVPYNTLNEKGFDIQNTGAGINAVFGGFKYHWTAQSELN